MKTDIGAENQFNIAFEAEKLMFRSNGMAIEVPGDWSDDQWHHYAMTVNRAHSLANIYVDETLRTPYVSFTVDENAAKQKALLVSTLSTSNDECTGHLNFTFAPATAAIRFYIKKANNLSDYILTVSSVKLLEVVKTGNYYYNTSTWTLGNVTSSYTLYYDTAKTLSNSDFEALDATEASYLFLIPQTLTAWAPPIAPANTYLELACTISKDGGSVFNGTAYIPFYATLAGGTQYDVKINIGKKSLYDNSGNKIITE